MEANEEAWTAYSTDIEERVRELEEWATGQEAWAAEQADLAREAIARQRAERFAAAKPGWSDEKVTKNDVRDMVVSVWTGNKKAQNVETLWPLSSGTGQSAQHFGHTETQTCPSRSM